MCLFVSEDSIEVSVLSFYYLVPGIELGSTGLATGAFSDDSSHLPKDSFHWWKCFKKYRKTTPLLCESSHHRICLYYVSKFHVSQDIWNLLTGVLCISVKVTTDSGHLSGCRSSDEEVFILKSCSASLGAPLLTGSWLNFPRLEVVPVICLVVISKCLQKLLK